MSDTKHNSVVTSGDELNIILSPVHFGYEARIGLGSHHDVGPLRSSPVVIGREAVARTYRLETEVAGSKKTQDRQREALIAELRAEKKELETELKCARINQAEPKIEPNDKIIFTAEPKDNITLDKGNVEQKDVPTEKIETDTFELTNTDITYRNIILLLLREEGEIVGDDIGPKIRDQLHLKMSDWGNARLRLIQLKILYAEKHTTGKYKGRFCRFTIDRGALRELQIKYHFITQEIKEELDRLEASVKEQEVSVSPVVLAEDEVVVLDHTKTKTKEESAAGRTEVLPEEDYETSNSATDRIKGRLREAQSLVKADEDTVALVVADVPTPIKPVPAMSAATRRQLRHEEKTGKTERNMTGGKRQTNTEIDVTLTERQREKITIGTRFAILVLTNLELKQWHDDMEELKSALEKAGISDAEMAQAFSELGDAKEIKEGGLVVIRRNLRGKRKIELTDAGKKYLKKKLQEIRQQFK